MADTQQLQKFNELLAQKIKEALPIQTVWAVCKSVDWDSRSMTATGVKDDLDYHEVLLGAGWEHKKPKPGTKCLLGVMENNMALTFLVTAEEIEEIEVTVSTATLKITPQGIKVEKDGENLFTCLADMITEINKILVLYGTSIDIAAMEAIKTRINKILI